jgi:hypothetical protein
MFNLLSEITEDIFLDQKIIYKCNMAGGDWNYYCLHTDFVN